MTAISTGPCLLCLAASQHMHTPLQQSPGHSNSVLVGITNGKGAPRVREPVLFHGSISRGTHLILIPLLLSFVLTSYVSFLQHWLHRSSAGFQFSMRIVPHIDVFLRYWESDGEVSSTILIPLSRPSLPLKKVRTS